MNSYPDDFQLFKIAEFDVITGELKVEKKNMILEGKQIAKEIEK